MTRGTPSGIEHVEVERHPDFELGQPEQLLHQQRGVDIAGLGLDDETHVLGRFVMDVGEQRQLFFFEQRRDLFDQPSFRHAKRDLGHDDLIGAVAQRLARPARPQPEAAAAGLVGLADIFRRLDQHPAGREIRAGDVGAECLDGAGRLVDQMQQCRAQLARIVRRDAGRHADGDARGAIGQQVREAGGQDDRLAVLAVIGLAEIDRVLVDAVEHRLRHRRQPALGVAHRRGVIAVDIAEIALAVDQRVALREILGEPDQRVIDRELAMRMELADHVADDAGAFLVARGGIEAQLLHRVQDAAMDRLQPVAHIGQRARHDRRQRIGQIALAERLGEIDLADLAGRSGHGHKSITSVSSRSSPPRRRGSRTNAGAIALDSRWCGNDGLSVAVDCISFAARCRRRAARRVRAGGQGAALRQQHVMQQEVLGQPQAVHDLGLVGGCGCHKKSGSANSLS